MSDERKAVIGFTLTEELVDSQSGADAPSPEAMNVAREVLANTARQCLEIHQYMTKFFDDVTSRAGVVGADWT